MVVITVIVMIVMVTVWFRGQIILVTLLLFVLLVLVMIVMGVMCGMHVSIRMVMVTVFMIVSMFMVSWCSGDLAARGCVSLPFVRVVGSWLVVRMTMPVVVGVSAG